MTAVVSYYRAGSLGEALEVCAGPGVDVLAGGTDLVTLRDAGHRTGSLVLDLKHVPELGGAATDGPTARVGPLTTMAELAGWGGVGYLAALAEGASVVGAPQTRTRATLGGNLCRSSPAGDTLPALLALETMVHIRSHDGERLESVADFLLGPGRNSLDAGEIVTALTIAHRRGGSAYERMTARASLDLAVVGVAVVVDAHDPDHPVVRVGLGGVAPTPILASAAGEHLSVPEVDSTRLVQAGRLAAEACRPISDVRASADYRRRAVGVLVQRVARRALDRAGVACV